MDIFEFTGKLIFEDIPELITEKIPREAENVLESISDQIDKFLKQECIMSKYVNVYYTCDKHKGKIINE